MNVFVIVGSLPRSRGPLLDLQMAAVTCVGAGCVSVVGCVVRSRLKLICSATLN